MLLETGDERGIDGEKTYITLNAGVTIDNDNICIQANP